MDGVDSAFRLRRDSSTIGGLNDNKLVKSRKANRLYSFSGHKQMVYLKVSYAQKGEAKFFGARWDLKKKLWYFPGEFLPKELEQFRPSTEGNGLLAKVILDIPFAYRDVAARAGAQWDTENKVYFFEQSPGDQLPIELAGFEPKEFSWEEKVQRELNGQSFESFRPEKKIILKPHQLEAVSEILLAYQQGYPGFLLADDVGLGKTFSAWAAILKILESSAERRKILIVCPLGVVANWRSSIRWMGTNQWVEEVVILNYDRLGKIFETKPRKGTKKISKRDLARRGAVSEKFDLILFDESHALKNLSALRSKFAIKLYESAKMIFWLSATAGQNPLELGYLLPILAKRTGDRALTTKDFEQWCARNLPGVAKGAYGAWAWTGDKEDEDQIRQLLFDPDQEGVKAALRRRPFDLIGWPEVNRIVHCVEFDGRAKDLYRLAWEEFKKALDGTESLSRQRAALVQNEAVIRFRQKSSLLKVEDTIELCQELLDNDRQVAISCEFLATMDAMEEALAKRKIVHARIDGQRTKTSQSKESERLRYQRGETRVILFNVAEGISLHEGETNHGGNNVPRCQIDHDLRWSAIQAHQIDGRSHRDGKFAQVYWVVAKETIDARVAEVLLRKLESMGNLQGDSTKDFEEIFNLIKE
jgi:superfamily II DNA or RNA helicase